MKFWLFAALAIWSAPAGASVEIHYAPIENLERIDVETLDNAERSIDMAAYVLSDARVIEALRDAADRGVTIRLYLDRSQFAHRGELAELLGFPNVSARVKNRGVLMHLKAYVVDGARLRTGSGNFSASGLEHQDNDLVLVDDAEAVSRFERDFEAMWSRAGDLSAAEAER